MEKSKILLFKSPDLDDVETVLKFKDSKNDEEFNITGKKYLNLGIIDYDDEKIDEKEVIPNLEDLKEDKHSFERECILF